MWSLNPDSLTRSHNKGALRDINLIKLKRSGKLKVRTCADGRPLILYITKEYASSTTISLEDLFASLIIDAHKGRDVAIFYVPGSYLNAYMPENKLILLNIEGGFVDIICELNPEQNKNVRVKNGVKVL